MSDPVTYSFYGTTVPILRNFTTSAINILTTAQNERSKATDGTFPTEQELLEAQFADMYSFRMQPIMLAKFAIAALQDLHLHGSTEFPALNPSSFRSFDDVIDFFKKLQAGFDAIDEKAYNESAEKSANIHLDGANITLQMSGLADYFHGFVIPNGYFHLNAMYMLLRSKGFSLGKSVYLGCWMSEQQQRDWAPLRAAKAKK
ncbi:hypothetical protein T440DRAFT_213410 [Plenodomus tracheiphilus IPT5]|uniref:Uncharacterized protein n=1 Tax=Plenodomus tracheiphilus IPT5 TaxID=1408161 RepID=A0A6A7AXN2_9PLEO|nr:hypothetical protein T440DRAFT_213410 [Plenodomus tracheiphilus IPT5]